LKAKKQDRGLRELFRSKLENAEIIPDVQVSTKLMRKLARKEFIRFNAARFNIYYLGAIMVAGITAALILFSESADNEKRVPLRTPEEIDKYESSVKTNLPDSPSPKQKTDTSNKNIFVSDENKPVIEKKIVTDRETDQNINPEKNNYVQPSVVIDSFTEKRLFANSSLVNNKLQVRLNPDELLFESSVTKGCMPLKVQFINKLTDYDSCQWTFGDGGSSVNKNPEWIFDVEGEYKVILKVFGPNGLLATSSVMVTVYPKPSSRFEFFPSKAVLPDDEISFQNYSAEAVKFFWNFGDGSTSELFEPVHRYSKFGNYNIRLVVYSEYGCSDSIAVLNAFSGSEYFIEFPNAFIPNQNGPSDGSYSSKSDESAQVFHPAFSGVSDYQLKIFSKLGVLLFESRDINTGWDGYFKGQLSNPGVYIWKVRGAFINGEPFIKMGDVTLIKN